MMPSTQSDSAGGPVRRLGSLHHKHKSMGAKFSQSNGWLIPASYGPVEHEAASVVSSVGLCDVSARVKVDLKGPDLDRLIAVTFPGSVPSRPLQVAVLSSKGVSNALEAVSPITLCRLTRDHAIMVSSRPGGPETSSLDAKFAVPSGFRGRAYATNVTSAMAGLAVAGPKSDLVLRKLTSIDVSGAGLSNFSCAEGGFARIHALVARSDPGAGLRAYELYFGREYSEYVWDAIMEAGREFAIAPFGHEAYARIFGKQEGP